MVDFINDAEQQYEAFCNIAEEYGFLDINAAKSGFRCAVKKPEFNAGWIAFTSAISTMKDHLSEKQAEINELKAKLEETQVPEGFVLVPKEKLSVFWQDDDEPENIVSDESDFNSLGDCIDLGDVMTIKKHTQANIETETLYGTWFAEVINPSEKANFFVGTHEECLDIVKKNKAMIEAAQGEGHE